MVVFDFERPFEILKSLGIKKCWRVRQLARIDTMKT